MQQQKVLLALAMICLATLPMFSARSMLEEGDLVSLATAALESGQAMSAEESMLMQASGTYGAGAMAGTYGGSAGGLLDNQGSAAVPVTGPSTPSTGLEAGNQDSTTAAPAAAAKPAAKSAASPAARSTGLAVAGVMVALTAFLL